VPVIDLILLRKESLTQCLPTKTALIALFRGPFHTDLVVIFFVFAFLLSMFNFLVYNSK
jgi:hypothetical protein